MRPRSIRGSLDRSFGLSLSSPECLSLEPSIWALSSVSFNSFLTQWSHKGNFKRIAGQKIDSTESDTALLKGSAWPFYSNYRPDWTVSVLFIYTFWLLLHVFFWDRHFSAHPFYFSAVCWSWVNECWSNTWHLHVHLWLCSLFLFGLRIWKLFLGLHLGWGE